MTIGLNMKSPGNSGAFFVSGRVPRRSRRALSRDPFFIGCLDRFGLLPALSGLCFRRCVSRRRGGSFPALFVAADHDAVGNAALAFVVEAFVVVGMVEDAFLSRPERRGTAAVEVQCIDEPQLTGDVGRFGDGRAVGLPLEAAMTTVPSARLPISVRGWRRA
jgi:hypothetical protein